LGRRDRYGDLGAELRFAGNESGGCSDNASSAVWFTSIDGSFRIAASALSRC